MDLLRSDLAFLYAKFPPAQFVLSKLDSLSLYALFVSRNPFHLTKEQRSESLWLFYQINLLDLNLVLLKLLLCLPQSNAGISTSLYKECQSTQLYFHLTALPSHQ